MGCKFDIVSRLATRQHGRVASRQLIARGIDRHTIQRWLDDRRLHVVHRGVYAVGHSAPSPGGEYMAAVLACGDDALISHRAAAHLLELRRGRMPMPEVTIPATAGRARPGIVIHRVRTLHPRDRSSVGGIPVTPVPRTLLDLAGLLPAKDLAQACHEAWIRYRTTSVEVERCIARSSSSRGVAALRRALGADVTLSALEDGFLELLRRHRLPLPRTNRRRHGDIVDCWWPECDLTVELVSYRFHASRRAFEADVARRRRSNHLAFTWGDVFERGPATVAELRSLLAA